MSVEQPQNIRVFVSSTFVDLFAEREYLVKRIFPELRHICRERGLIFTEVDLRWGLTYEDSSFGRVISTCLQEIDRCRPFFIGILGDRYGWIPEFQDIHKNAFLMEEHRWLEEAVLEGSSLVEMEFNYAVLHSNEPMPGASFYVLERNEENAKPGVQQDVLADRKIEQLRNRIFECKRPVRTFSTPEELGRLVREDLLRAIDVLHPAKNERSPLARERRLHEAFAISRRQAYVARQENLKRLSDHAEAADTQPLIVFGPSGLGKSALLAYWSRFFAQRHPDMTIVTHFIGSVSSDTGHEGLLRRILSEIKDLFAIEDAVPNSVGEMEAALTAWLAKVPEKRLVLVIDALNQLETGASGMEWLPDHLPTNVRIIFSTTPGPTLDALRARQWPEYELLPLTVQDREAMITRFLSEFHKSLSLAECREIARSEKASNPLFLRTLLEELRLFGTFEELDKRIAYYLTAADIGDLFQRVLERIEGDFGADLIRKVMSYVWAARNGITEEDFLALTKLLRSDASQLLIALEYHLVQRHGYIRFFHDYLREAVERKYLTDEESRRSAHAELGEFYLHEPTSERRASELPYQLGEGGMFYELKEWLTNIPEFMRYATEDEQWRYIGYWLKLERKYDRVEAYQDALAEYQSAHTELEYADALEQVGRFMNICGEYVAASLMLEASLPIIEAHFGPTSEKTANALMNFGKLLTSRGEYAKAERPLKQALDIQERLFGKDNEIIAKGLDSLATNYYYLGKYSDAETLLRRALDINRAVLGESHARTIGSITNLGVMLFSQRQLDEAQAVFSKGLAIVKSANGTHDPNYSSLLNNLAALARAQGDLKRAKDLLREALKNNQIVLGPENLETINSLQNLALIEKLSGDLSVASALYMVAIDVSKRKRGETHPETAKLLLNLGQLKLEEKEWHEALTHLETARTIFQETVGARSNLAITTELSIGEAYLNLGDYARSKSIFDTYFAKSQMLESSRGEIEHWERIANKLHEFRKS